jgi:hypothetical protein
MLVAPYYSHSQIMKVFNEFKCIFSHLKLIKTYLG